ncbi:MAG TPA: SprT-like domain-containing protein [Candidatus Enterenecus stercoripullorum]|nr:SprT-like domain-containing protein [Candidatus Enterenecus stercoripullorum]
MANQQQRLDALLSQVIAQAKALGIPVSPHISPRVRVNRRAKTRFGCCRTTWSGHTIEVAAALCGAQENAVRQVLAHEVLHTCPGCANHGPQWRCWAKQMNEAYGYHIQRTDSYQALGLSDPRPVRYLVVCQSCGHQIPRMKRSPLVDNPERYRCRCGGRLQVFPGSGQSVPT